MPAKPDTLPISLALQGGGSHGAFTWGVLDALLEDGRFAIEGISGTSAGAMNAVMLAHGFVSGGRDGARAALSEFWSAVAASSPFTETVPCDPGQLPATLRLMLHWAQHLSPAQLNPFDINPLREIIGKLVDFERLRGTRQIDLFIAATHANSGKLRIFRNPELSVDTLLASACLPTVHHTVTIAGEPYWDGGYSANPAVFPLFWECATRDILLVLLSPLHYPGTPVAATDIRARLQELAFNNTFLREMRMFAHLAGEAGKKPRSRWLPRWLVMDSLEQRLADTRFHAITTAAVLAEMPAASRLATGLSFLLHLRDAGREQALAWLNGPGEAVGRRHGIDIARVFY